MTCDVLVVGAGPTGLVLALWLNRLGLSVRIVDRTAEPGTTSRALAVHARTLELYGQLDLAREVVARGRVVTGANLWVGGKRRAHLALDATGAEMTPYPFLHIFPQDEHERLLVERLAAAGVVVERRTELMSFEEQGGRVVAKLRTQDGGESVCESAYIAGCDGAHSRVRHELGVDFEGGAYDHLFYVADIDAGGPPADGQLHIDLEQADFLAVFPLAQEARVRLIGTVRDARASQVDGLGIADVSRDAIDDLRLEIKDVNWFSTYHVHHRVAQRFRVGRAFLLGDAAHIHSPVGGQGMNTGIGDAINLAWKLRAAVRGAASDWLLDTYETERIAFARRLVHTTDRVFTIVTAPGRFARLVRTRVAPGIVAALARIPAVRRAMFRTVSQLDINYRGSRLSAGAAGGLRGGDRMPWAGVGGGDNYAGLSDLRWHVQVFGEIGADLAAACAEIGAPVERFDWSDSLSALGLARNTVYLVRPDAYIGFVGADAAALRAYAERAKLKLS